MRTCRAACDRGNKTHTQGGLTPQIASPRWVRGHDALSKLRTMMRWCWAPCCRGQFALAEQNPARYPGSRRRSAVGGARQEPKKPAAAKKKSTPEPGADRAGVRRDRGAQTPRCTPIRPARGCLRRMRAGVLMLARLQTGCIHARPTLSPFSPANQPNGSSVLLFCREGQLAVTTSQMCPRYRGSCRLSTAQVG